MYKKTFSLFYMLSVSLCSFGSKKDNKVANAKYKNIKHSESSKFYTGVFDKDRYNWQIIKIMSLLAAGFVPLYAVRVYYSANSYVEGLNENDAKRLAEAVFIYNYILNRTRKRTYFGLAGLAFKKGAEYILDALLTLAFRSIVKPEKISSSSNGVTFASDNCLFSQGQEVSVFFGTLAGIFDEWSLTAEYKELRMAFELTAAAPEFLKISALKCAISKKLKLETVNEIKKKAFEIASEKDMYYMQNKK
jgi:hypothetical protein